ncbi:protein involved in gliding motility GldM [Lutibacter sp. Hel_I_33_5]|uniref:type IX secretion system motor protein PorM/GldM n=1 Tax=Lutibacter sp. Hel_I_33_5 TaxID=1566289 RepID=UPI00119E879B|nr:gliding motility protein GldM [Lutibacter sp. Hel_I_33_5]TVZ56768.1 protein involved in gliding motility GldM [Lutibacter sp. Hel_I_33_5]
MASGKESARQKMINLMYLVFIAMLAMNMSKEVLSAFGFMNERLTENNASTTEKNNSAYDNLATKASEQAAKFGPLKEQADKIKTYSADFYSYLEDLKAKMTAKVEDKTAYESMDKTDFLDEYFFKGDGFTPEGSEFLNKINSYRTNVSSVLGADNKFTPIVAKRFNTDDINRGGKKTQKWLKARYEGFPLVASLTNLTQMQADIKNTESDIVSDLLGGKLEEALSLSNYQGIVQLDKTAYFSGDRVQGKVVLGRYDATMVPDKVTLNGRNYTNIKAGQVIIDMPAGNVGNKKIKGSITFTQNGEPVDVPFSSDFSVISQPDEAVISADKMNVVYRGLDNPISVSLPGVGDKDLTVSASGLRKVGAGKYMIRPGASNQVNINVTGKLNSGKTVTSKKVFRVKDIPPAMGMARGEFGIVKMPKASLGRTSIGAGLPDFVFDLKLQVQGFTVKVPGQLAIKVVGSKLNARAKRTLDKARRGDVITIFDIKATIVGNSSYQLKKVLPVSIELTN